MEEDNDVKFGTGMMVWSIIGSIIPKLLKFKDSIVVFGIITSVLYIWLLVGKKRLAF